MSRALLTTSNRILLHLLLPLRSTDPYGTSELLKPPAFPHPPKPPAPSTSELTPSLATLLGRARTGSSLVAASSPGRSRTEPDGAWGIRPKSDGSSTWRSAFTPQTAGLASCVLALHVGPGLAVWGRKWGRNLSEGECRNKDSGTKLHSFPAVYLPLKHQHF